MGVGRWAYAVHLCYDYPGFGSMKAPARGRVRPLLFGEEPLPWPTLVSLAIHDIKPIPTMSASWAINSNIPLMNEFSQEWSKQGGVLNESCCV
jgi:hypothetical protein